MKISFVLILKGIKYRMCKFYFSWCIGFLVVVSEFYSWKGYFLGRNYRTYVFILFLSSFRI